MPTPQHPRCWFTVHLPLSTVRLPLIKLNVSSSEGPRAPENWSVGNFVIDSFSIPWGCFSEGNPGARSFISEGCRQDTDSLSVGYPEACLPAHMAHPCSLRCTSSQSQGSRGSCRSQQCSCRSRFHMAAGHTRWCLSEQSPQLLPSPARAMSSSGTKGLGSNWYYLLLPFYWWENWGTGKWICHFFKVLSDRMDRSTVSIPEV